MSSEESIDPLDEFHRETSDHEELPVGYGSGGEVRADVAASPAREEPQPEPPLGGRYQSLVVLEPEVLARGGDSGDPDAPWSFRAQMAWLADEPQRLGDYTLGWLSAWADGDAEGGTPGRPGVRSRLIESWVSESGEAGSTVREMRWQDSPFRLIAIVNRVDLAESACDGFGGELRFVYAARDWRYDEELQATVIVEIPLPDTQTAAAWSRRFQQLEGMSGAELAQALARITDDVKADAQPLLGRLRTNEIGLGELGDGAWQMREFRPQIVAGQLAMRPVTLEFTPDADADPARLAQHVLDLAAEIRRRPVPLPAELRARVATLPSEEFRWDLPGISDALNEAFSRNTCNGCHGANTEALPFQHIAPDADPGRPAHLSRFLYAPDAEQDDLRRRQYALDELAASECEPLPEGAEY